MPNIKLTVSYDGTAYHGFQDQGEGHPTIQACLEQAIARLTGEHLRITGAGRTDAGVHALGQVVNVRTESTIPIDRWPYAMNSVLPYDIVIHEAEEAAPSFHARYSAIGKTYRYSIHRGRFRDVFTRAYAYHVSEPLDVEAMQAAVALLVGRHDFAAFRSTGSSVTTTVREVHQADISCTGDMIHVEVSADGFLYNMVRIIVGTLLDVGRGRRSVLSVGQALVGRDRSQAGATAPPHGLCLLQVHYPSEDPVPLQQGKGFGRVSLDTPSGSALK